MRECPVRCCVLYQMLHCISTTLGSALLPKHYPMPSPLDNPPPPPSKKYPITPFFIIGFLLMLVSSIAFISAIFNELTGKGSKGTITVIILSTLTFALTLLVLFLERRIMTKAHKSTVILGEILLLIVIAMRLYSLSYG